MALSSGSRSLLRPESQAACCIPKAFARRAPSTIVNRVFRWFGIGKPCFLPQYRCGFTPYLVSWAPWRRTWVAYTISQKDFFFRPPTLFSFCLSIPATPSRIMTLYQATSQDFCRVEKPFLCAYHALHDIGHHKFPKTNGFIEGLRPNGIPHAFWGNSYKIAPPGRRGQAIFCLAFFLIPVLFDCKKCFI